MNEQHPVDVVLSAERVSASTRRSPRERVRVRREVVSEEVTVTVTVRREVLRIEREPLSSDGSSDGSTAGPGVSPADGLPAEVVLSRERPVVSLEVVPYERVRLEVRSTGTTTPVSTTASREVLDLVDDGLDAVAPLA